MLFVINEFFILGNIFFIFLIKLDVSNVFFFLFVSGYEMYNFLDVFVIIWYIMNCFFNKVCFVVGVNLIFVVLRIFFFLLESIFLFIGVIGMIFLFIFIINVVFILDNLEWLILVINIWFNDGGMLVNWSVLRLVDIMLVNIERDIFFFLSIFINVLRRFIIFFYICLWFVVNKKFLFFFVCICNFFSFFGIFSFFKNK